MIKSLPILLALSISAASFAQQSGETELPSAKYLNPASFVHFVENGHYYTSRMNSSNNSQSVKASSVIRIEFLEIPEEYRTMVQLTISAYIKTVDDNIIPIDISGFAKVSGEKLQQLSATSGGVTEDMSTKITYSAHDYTELVATEIDLKAISGLKEGDLIVFEVMNVKANSAKHCMSFVIDDFGWKGEASSGPVWVKTYNSERVNFETAPFAGYSFHYQHRKNGRFWYKFITPSFGPSAVLVDNAGSKFGLGMQVSVLARTVTLGSGYFLNESGDRKQREYYYIGVNFLEGIDAFKEILSTSKAD